MQEYSFSIALNMSVQCGSSADLALLRGWEVARSERFELPTLGIEIRCSIQLSYERIGRCNTERVGLSQVGLARHAEVFAFGGEFFNTR